jgi:hypothetical protein
MQATLAIVLLAALGARAACGAVRAGRALADGLQDGL